MPSGASPFYAVIRGPGAPIAMGALTIWNLSTLDKLVSTSISCGSNEQADAAASTVPASRAPPVTTDGRAGAFRR